MQTSKLPWARTFIWQGVDGGFCTGYNDHNMGACLRSTSLFLAGLLLAAAGPASAQDRVPADAPPTTSSPATRPSNPAGQFLSGAELAVTVRSAALIIGEMLAATDQKESERLGKEVLDALRPALRDPALADINAWIVAGSLAHTTKDEKLAVLAYEAIARLKPDYYENENTLTLMARLKRFISAEDVKKAAEARSGLVDAMTRPDRKAVYIGTAYSEGNGVLQSPTDAIAWFERAARAGEVDAMYNLSLIYEQARGVAADETKAFEWMRRAAEHGDREAIWRTATRYVKGRGVEKSETAASLWFQRAAVAGDVDGMVETARRFAIGLGVHKDEASASKWYQKAAEANNPIGMRRLAGRLKEGIGLQKNAAEAAAWFEKAANAGDAMSMNEMGVSFAGSPSTGWKRRVDDETAVEWYKKGRAAGSEVACANLAYCYLEGKGVEKSQVEAFKLFNEAATKGDSRSMRQVGLYYLNGEGVSVDKQLAASWLKKAAEAGDPRGMGALALCYERGLGLPLDLREAKRWYEEALRHDYDPAGEIKDGFIRVNTKLITGK